MKRRKFKIPPKLLNQLLDENFREFKMLELRDAFEAGYGLQGCENSSALRRWLYRNILRLIKKGYLDKTNSEGEQTVIYRLTKQFDDEFRIAMCFEEAEHQSELLFDDQTSPQTSALKTKFNQYQVDMLVCAGECKEYQKLAIEYPHLREQIEPMYRIAQDHSSELMGQLRAINNLLNRSSL
jgi:hypothetical protein